MTVSAPKLQKIKVLLTATGAPGCSTLIRKLKNNGEREIEIVATDANEDVIGAFWADRFYTVPWADSPDYIPAIEDIIKAERPDILFPVSSMEVLPVSQNRARLEALGPKVMVSDSAAIELAIDKLALYSLLAASAIPVPEFRHPKNVTEFIAAARELGYPKKRVCFKPRISKGGRGFRILDETISRRDLLLLHKPQSRYMSLGEFVEIFEVDENFPDIILMEVVDGEEYDSMALCWEGDALLTTVKTREQSRWGTITAGELVNRPEVVELVRDIIPMVPLSYNVSLQFIGRKLIEINPRTSTFIYQPDLNEPYLALKLCLGEIGKEEIRRYQSKIRYGRRMIRYMDQLSWDKNESCLRACAAYG